jgi:uncharacterized protein (TIGR02246 family)
MKQLAMFLTVLFITASIINAQDAKSFIEQSNQKWEQAMLNNDFNSVLNLYADDAISLPSYAPMMRGKQEISDAMKKDMEAGNRFTEVDFNTIEVREEGDVAIEIGTYNMTMKMKEGGEDWSDTGKYITVWEKQGNEWKVAIESWNSDTNPWQQMKEKQEAPQDEME